MSFEFIRKLPTPTDIKRDFPVPERVAELKKEPKNVEELRFIFISPTCILADSVDLGKKFAVLSVIKYYENKNK